jgi:hypothetical protein
MARRRTRSEPDLTAAIEEFAARIGDQIGSGIARALGDEARTRTAARETTCAKEGCTRPVAARGLCKSHYNLMLYHRRKAETAKAKKSPRRRRS